MKMEKSKCENLDLDKSVDIEIIEMDDLEENLCRKYYQVKNGFIDNMHNK